MLQIEDSILNFFQLVLRVFFGFIPDVLYKQSGFPKTLFQKDPKFVSKRRNGPVAFDLSFMLLPTKTDLILKEQDYKRYMLITLDSNSFEKVLALLTEVIALHMQVFII